MELKRRTIIKNKKGGFSDLFLLIIFSLVIIVASVLFLFMTGEAKTEIHNTLGQMDLHDTEGNNASEVIDNTIGDAEQSFKSLQWITVLLIVGMILSIFIGSYLVTTKPIFLVPYLFLVIIAVFVSVPISNTYETLLENATLQSTFAEFSGASWIMLNLPMWISIIGIIGGIIMFSRMGTEQEAGGYY